MSAREFTSLVVLLPVVVLLLSVPLVLKMIPPNRLYGVRTAKTYSSSDLWYAGNRIGGIYMIVASLCALILGLVLSRAGFGPAPTVGAILATIVAGAVATLIRVHGNSF